MVVTILFSIFLQQHRPLAFFLPPAGLGGRQGRHTAPLGLDNRGQVLNLRS